MKYQLFFNVLMHHCNLNMNTSWANSYQCTCIVGQHVLNVKKWCLAGLCSKPKSVISCCKKSPTNTVEFILLAFENKVISWPLLPCLNHQLTYDPSLRPRPTEAPLINQIYSFHIACPLPNVKQPRLEIRGIHLAGVGRDDWRIDGCVASSSRVHWHLQAYERHLVIAASDGFVNTAKCKGGTCPKTYTSVEKHPEVSN